MKKTIKLWLALAVMMLTGATQAWAVDRSFTLEFQSSNESYNLAETIKDFNGIISGSGNQEVNYSDITVANAAKVYQAKYGYGFLLGSAATEGQLTLALPKTLKVKSMSIYAASYKNGEESININGDDYDLTAQISRIDTTFEEAQSLSEIAIKAQRAYISRIDVNYESDYLIPTSVGISVWQDCDLGTYVEEQLKDREEQLKQDGYQINQVYIYLYSWFNYTISKPIEVGCPLYINGNYATIDASELDAPFIQLSTTPVPAVGFVHKTSDETGEAVTDYYDISQISVNSLNIKGLKNSIFWDNNTKYCVRNFQLDNVNIELNTTATKFQAFIAFQAGGAKDLTVSSSTIYQTGAAENNYFVRYINSSRLDRYGFDKKDENDNCVETQSINFYNNTFYNVGNKGQWCNYNGFNGQKYSSFYVENNIWVDCGNGQIARRIVGSRDATSYNNCNFNYNTYWFNGAAETSNTSYDTGTQLTTDPGFTAEDIANGEFWVADGTQQKLFFTGDNDWFNVQFGGRYNVNVVNDPHGWHYTISRGAGYQAGSTVTVEGGADNGYAVKEMTGTYYYDWSAAKAGRRAPGLQKEFKLEQLNDNTWYFVMPESNVDINVTYTTVLGKNCNLGYGWIDAQDWTGSEIKPGIEIWDWNEEKVIKDEEGNWISAYQLEEGKDYEITYADNIEAGVATVTVKGIGDYSGEYTTYFQIIKTIEAETTDLVAGDIVAQVYNEESKQAVITSIQPNDGETTVTIPATIGEYDVAYVQKGALKSATSIDVIYTPEEVYVPVSDAAFINTKVYTHPSVLPKIETPTQFLDDYANDLERFTAAHKVYTKFTQKADKYSTFSADVNVLLPEGLKANYVKAKSETEVEKYAVGSQYIAASTGVMLEGTKGVEYIITAVPEVPAVEANKSADAEDNLLVAVTEAKHFDAGEGYYILKAGKFVAVADDDAEVPANKAVLRLPDAAPVLSIVNGGNTTGINAINAAENNGVIYDLNGRQVKSAQKGVFIQNGKKVIIK